MIGTSRDEMQAAIRLKDFTHENEAYVREEFLVPLFRCSGYDAIGTSEILRGVNLARTCYPCTETRHVFPDFVLAKNGIALWIIDAKTPISKPNSLRWCTFHPPGPTRSNGHKIWFRKDNKQEGEAWINTARW